MLRPEVTEEEAANSEAPQVVLKKPASNDGGMKRPAAASSHKSLAKGKAKAAPKDSKLPKAPKDAQEKEDTEEQAEVAEETPTASKRRKAHLTPEGWGNLVS